MTLKYKIKETVKGVVDETKKAESPHNWLQNTFLEECIKRGKEVEVLTVDGKRLRGVIAAYDNFSFLLSTERGEILIYKHGVIYLEGGR